MNTVAVYGSLRVGLHNHSLLAGSEFVGEFKTSPEFKMYSLGSFPAIVPDAGGYPITVELYDVDAYTFRRLDQLEGCPDWYQRKQIQVGEHTAWIYYHTELHDTEVLSGNWKEYCMYK